MTLQAKIYLTAIEIATIENVAYSVWFRSYKLQAGTRASKKFLNINYLFLRDQRNKSVLCNSLLQLQLLKV